jgi:hypothetical protein
MLIREIRETNIAVPDTTLKPVDRFDHNFEFKLTETTEFMQSIWLDLPIGDQKHQVDLSNRVFELEVDGEPKKKSLLFTETRILVSDELLNIMNKKPVSLGNG